MSYVLDVAPDAAATWRALDFETQEAVFDLLDRIADDAAQLPGGQQTHRVDVVAPPWSTFAVLWVVVNHESQTIRLRALVALTHRSD